MKRLFVLLMMVALGLAARGEEVRWCAVTGLGEGQRLVYPPIARAARVSGLVIGRVQYRTDGTVVGCEVVSGPVMLSQFVGVQVKRWTIGTSAVGEPLCQSLVVADFGFEGEPQLLAPRGPAGASGLRISVRAEAIGLSDPMFTVSTRFGWFRRVLYRLHLRR